MFITRRAKPLCDVPSMIRGNQPTDGGDLLLTPEERLAHLFQRYAEMTS